MKDKMLLFIPAYNCEKQITRVLTQLTEDVLEYIEKIIVVNNCSTDGTEQAVLEYHKCHVALPLSLLRNDENYGLGGSHKVAFQYALQHHFDYVIVLHGDDQGQIRDILPLLQSGEYRKYDCCLGARFMKGSVLPGYSLFRTFGNHVYNLLFSLVCGRRIYDLGSGLNLYKSEMLSSQFFSKFPDNLVFNYCMVMALKYYKQNSFFFPISWREDDQISNVKLFSQAKRVLQLLASFCLNAKEFISKEHRDISRTAYTAKSILNSEIEG